jgi:hypothetical protein
MSSAWPSPEYVGLNISGLCSMGGDSCGDETTSAPATSPLGRSLDASSRTGSLPHTRSSASAPEELPQMGFFDLPLADLSWMMTSMYTAMDIVSPDLAPFDISFANTQATSPRISEVSYRSSSSASDSDASGPAAVSPGTSVAPLSPVVRRKSGTRQRKNSLNKRSKRTSNLCPRSPIRLPDGSIILRCQFEGEGCDEMKFLLKCKQTKHHQEHKRPLRCDVEGCEATQAHSRDMHRHMWSHHEAIAEARGLPGLRARCPHCHKGFNRPDAVKKHIKGACPALP